MRKTLCDNRLPKGIDLLTRTQAREAQDWLDRRLSRVGKICMEVGLLIAHTKVQ